ncbi:IclR family transcriptional regulator [Bordetella muralis]|uniref:IclR family transcriptional regulator n=1 Tax=Bordetella muralis TaxID=1649130 RepID=UPI0039EF83CD
MKEDRMFVTALHRGLEVLRCFTPDTPELGTSEIARMTGLPQPTVWRLCYTLSQSGYLIPGRNADRLRVGPGVLTLGHASITHAGVAEFAYPLMKVVAEKFEASVSLAEPDRHNMVIVQRAESPAILKLILHVGSQLEMVNSSLGWAYLAALPDAERTSLLTAIKQQLGKAWKVHATAVEEAIAHYNEHGFVFNLRHSHRDVNAIGVPVISPDGRRILALTCGGNSSYMTKERLAGPIAAALKELARQIAPALAGEHVARHRNVAF